MAKNITRTTIMKIKRSSFGVETVEDEDKIVRRFFWETKKQESIRRPSSPVNSSPAQHAPIKEIIPVTKDCLVLIIKADGASTLIERVLKTMHLQPGDEADLFINTMKMWNGTSQEFEKSNLSREFYREEATDSFVKEYDYFAIRFKLPYNYKGAQKNADSYERTNFFKQICEDQVDLIAISKRLCFDDSIQNEAFNIN